MSHSIAIVDDEHDTVQLFKDILTTNGYDVTGFTNPLLALEHIKENQEEFDLVLSDYRMPYLHGSDLAQKITEINVRIKVIIITALHYIDNNPLNLTVFIKPISLSKLIDIVRNNISIKVNN